MRAMTKTTGPIIDFDTDDDLQAALANAASGATSVTIRVFGEEFALRTVINGFTLLSVLDGNPTALRDAMLGLVHADDHDRFAKTLSTNENLDAAALAVLYGKMVEAVSARPTQSPSRSSAGAKKRTSATKSKGASSSQAVVPIR